jgi:hypothetical protein
MNPRETLSELAGLLQQGKLSLEAFLDRACDAGVAVLPESQVDIDRQRRCGFPEVIYGQGKTPQAIEAIFRVLLERGTDVLATRIDEKQAGYLSGRFPTGRRNAVARTFRIPRPEADAAPPQGRVVIVTAGTGDRPVAEEALETARWMGTETTLVYDVGVAGPQRLVAHLETLRAADAIVVVAGMEGALASVVGGHVACPVIAVPTSVGYGASFGGVAALLAMINSCAANVSVVNIDAGFKGGYVAAMIARAAARARAKDGSP